MKLTKKRVKEYIYRILSVQKYKLGRNIKAEAGKRFPIQGDKEKIRSLKVDWDIKSDFVIGNSPWS